MYIYSPVLLDLFLSSEVSICPAVTFHSLGNSDHIVVSVSINFPLKPNGDNPFHCLALDYSCVTGMVFVII